MYNNIFVRLLLVGFLFLSTLLQHTHIFAHHDHPICDDIKLHIHAIDTTCELLDYVSNVYAVVPLVSFLPHAQSSVLETILQTTKAYAKAFNAKRLRAPPIF